MAFDVQTFLTRAGSAVVFAAVMLVGLLWNEWAFIALFLLVTIIALKEYRILLEKIVQVTFTKQEKANYMAAGIATYLVLISLHINVCNNFVNSALNHAQFYLIGLLIGFLILFFMFKKNPKANYLLSGISYVALSFGLLVQLRYQSLMLPVILILSIWINDTMAYLTGSFIGKTKIAPAISPKKTIEGTLGGIVFTLVIVYIWGINTSWFPVWQWLIIGTIASVVGTIGDLVESKLKRMADVKDSGNIMPGHGGALDRFDSLLFAAPFAFLFALLAMACFEYHVFG